MIDDGPRDPIFNMAADAYLLHAAEVGEGAPAPVVRIYGWEVPAITIGYHQSPERAVDLTKIGDTPIVRRITGGRALLHEPAELTYAVAGNFVKYPGLGATLRQTYQLISQAIIAFYAGLGWQAEMARRDTPVSLSGSAKAQKGCFASVSHYEITVAGVKVAASSQRRTKTAMLQHGSIKLATPGKHPAILESADPGNALPPILTRTRDQLESSLAASFGRIYEVEFRPEDFTPLERDHISQLDGEYRNLNPDTD